MKLLYDYQIFALQKFGGISRYFVELLNQFYSSDHINFEFPLYFSNNEHLRNARFSDHKTFLPDLRLGLKNKYTRYLNKKNKVNSVISIEKNDFDVFHPTYYDPYFIDHLKEKPFVLTVHDLTSEIFPEYFKNAEQITEQKKYLLEKASRIITISKNSKNDIIKYFHTDENKIDIIPLAVSLGTANRKRGMPILKNVPQKFLLFVGNRKGYKNFSALLEAYSLLGGNYDGICLVCAGGGSFSKKEKSAIKEFNLSGRVYYFAIDDNILKILYGKAIAFVFPSLYEGFGIPILEAFHCKCPVLLSNSSSFPEVAGEAGLYFDPQSPDSIKKTIIRVCEDDEIREKLVSEGIKKLRDYSWEKTAEMTLNSYKSIV